jgi:hypothetical protein
VVWRQLAVVTDTATMQLQRAVLCMLLLLHVHGCLQHAPASSLPSSNWRAGRSIASCAQVPQLQQQHHSLKVQQCRCRQCTYVALLRVSVSAIQPASSTKCHTCHCTVLLSCRPSKDPRFDQTIGGKSFSNEAYSRRYAFLYDEVLPQERAALKQQLKVRALPGVSEIPYVTRLVTCHIAHGRCMRQLLAG